MFNNIFECGYFPDSWSKAFIVPLLKKGDKNNPNNCRGISIVSCFGKLFTSILNNRILAWERDHNILTDVQFGFRSGLAEFYVKTNVYIVALWIIKRHLTLLIELNCGKNYSI